MAEGYKLQVQGETGPAIEIPTYNDLEGNKISDFYAKSDGYVPLRDKLRGLLEDAIISSYSPINCYSWDAISAISKARKAPYEFHIGDEKSITLSTGERITMVILGFDHDDLTEGGRKAGITFGMKGCLETLYPVYTEGAASGEWKTSQMRTSTMEMLYGLLPHEVQAVIKPVNKKAFYWDTKRYLASIETVSDKLFLLSKEEVIGDMRGTVPDPDFEPPLGGEGNQYEYFKNAPVPKSTEGVVLSEVSGTGCFYTTDTTTEMYYTNRFGEDTRMIANNYYNYNALKAQGNFGTTAIDWWLRTNRDPLRSFNETIHATGRGSQMNGSYFTCGVSFAFCV